MNYTPYRILALIPPFVDISFAKVIGALRAKYINDPNPPQIGVVGHCCGLGWDNWTLNLCWKDHPSVLEDSQQLARFASSQGIDASIMSTCSRLITVDGDFEPDRLHLNQYASVVDVLKGFEGILLLSVQSF